VDPRLQRRIQRYGWDRAEEHYERFWSDQLAPAQMRLLALAELREGEHVLDIACGTGLVTFPAATRVGPSGRVVGTDLSEKMVATATQRARGKSNVSFLRQDAERLEFADDSFDAALCALGLMYVPDPLKALSEMHRVLKPGGRAVVAVWGKRDRCGWADIFPIVDQRVQSEVCPMFFRLGTGATLEHELEAAGFHGIVTERLSTKLHYADDREAIGAAFAGGPVALAYSKFDDRTRDEAHAEYLASIEPYRREQSYEVPGEFVVARGARA
jgi:ubiquinone/menaquinone biosynthesis C-methylase UbiE